MKFKLKLDKKTLQQFFVEQSEKVAFGAVVVLVLLVVYFALVHGERYDRTPVQLVEAARRAEEQIKQSPPESGVVVPDYVSKAKRSRVHIEEKPYAYTARLDEPLFLPRRLRDVPPVYAVQQLRGTAEVGAFRVAVPQAHVPKTPKKEAAAPKGTEEIRGQRWISLVALVPVEKQATAFKEAFSGTVHYEPQKDYPYYLGFWVERVEVASPGEAADPDWKKATIFNLNDAVRKAEKEWPPTHSGSDVVPEKYLEPRLVFPLGPLVNRPWGPSVVHPPEISIKRPDELRTGGGMEGGAVSQPRPPKPADDGAVAPAADSPFPDQETKPDAPVSEPVNPTEEDKAPEYKLCRFFDFTVEPGKHYVYRVRLALRNPNRGLRPAYLKKPELAEVKFLETNWSEPSTVISVPRDVRVFAVWVKPPLRQTGEPLGRVLVTKWVQRKGIEAFKEFSVVRGQVANFLNEPFKPHNAPSFKVHFVTDATTIDLRGGGRLPGKRGSDPMFEPGEVLLLDPDGTLMVRNEMEDAPIVEDITTAGQELEQVEGKMPGGMMGGPPPAGALDNLAEPLKKKAAKK